MGKSKKKKSKNQGPTLKRTTESSNVINKRSLWDVLAIYIVCVMAVITFFLHLNGASYFHRGGALTFDETLYTRIAYQIREGGEYSSRPIFEEQKKKGRFLPTYVNQPIFKHPPVFATLIRGMYSFLPTQSSYQLSVLYEYAVKVSCFMGAFLVLLIFLLARKMYDYRVGLLASFLTAIELNIWLCSQKVWIEATLCFFFWLSLYFIYKAFKDKKYFYFAGIAAGLAMLSKYNAVLIFPILVSYAAIYERRVFKQKEFYLFFVIVIAMFMPWLYDNYKVYGAETFRNVIVMQKGNTKPFILFSKVGGVIVLLTGLFVMFKKYGQKLKEAVNEKSEGIQLIAMIIVGLALALLVVQKPFLQSIGKTLSWSGLPVHGWKMGLYNEEPWYLYIKQHLEYSPLYIFWFISFVLMVRGPKEDKFLMLTCLWVLSFAIIWGNFQGRYVINFTPAAMILIAKTIMITYEKLLSKKTIFYRSITVVFSCILLYFLIKTLRVDYLIAIKGSLAYF